MSDFLCRNCGQPMGLRNKVWFHYDSACDKPELEDDDKEFDRALPEPTK